MDLGLTNSVAMVAGASKGLGFAVARLLAAEGAHVSIASRDSAAIEKAKEQISITAKGKILSISADVRNSKDLERWKEQTLQKFNGVDMLFANSGGPPTGTFASFDDHAWHDAIELLLMSAVRMSRIILPVMKRRGGGSILFSTSTSVKESIENLTLSNVIRASIPALAKTLAKEYVKDNIRVNHIIPGRIDTDRLRELDTFNSEKKNITLEEQQKAMFATIPMGRYGDADEFARAAVFLLSPAASYITGATLQVDGGSIKSVV